MTAVLIFIATLLLVITQPRGLGIGWSAATGAIASLLLGTVTLSDIPTVWSIVWNASGTLIGLIIITLVLDEAGFFRWCALKVARASGGSGAKLFTLIILLGAVMSAFLANDGAVLILTPVVLALLTPLGVSKAQQLAFVMAAGFIVDTASLPLVSSNLVNIISADFFRFTFTDYALVMIPVDIASVAASLAVLWIVFRRSVPKRVDLSRLPAPDSVIRDSLLFRAGWVVLTLQLVFCFASSFLRIPISAVTLASAAILLLLSRKNRVVPAGKVLKDAPWSIVIFSLGMYLVVYGLQNDGATSLLSAALSRIGDSGTGAAAFGAGFIAAALSSVMNNLPSTMIGALSIDAASVSDAVRTAMAYANVIGCDLGPKITPIGSLATLLWLSLLSHKGIRVTWGYYFRLGLILTIPVLAASLAALALVI